jgi:Tfp pilus assembly protein PilF
VLDHAQRAVATAPDSAYAHVALSRAFVHHRRWEEAEREMRRACELAPRSGVLCGSMQAWLCSALGCAEDELAGARLYANQTAADPGVWNMLSGALIEAARRSRGRRLARSRDRA